MKMIKDPSKHFYCCDGSVFKSLADFRKALKTMPDDVYAYHMERGDFSRWVGEVVKDKALAKKLSGKSKKGAQRVLAAKKTPKKAAKKPEKKSAKKPKTTKKSPKRAAKKPKTKPAKKKK